VYTLDPVGVILYREESNMATSARTYLLPDDILTAILELARQEKNTGDQFVFRGHDEELQKVFYDLSSDPNRVLLRSFVFSTSGPRPYSPALSDSVSKLQLAGLLGRQNPDYEFVFTTSSARSYYDTVLSKKFSEDEKNQLKEIAKEFLLRIRSM
jgi:hypothetical protein